MYDLCLNSSVAVKVDSVQMFFANITHRHNTHYYRVYGHLEHIPYLILPYNSALASLYSANLHTYKHRYSKACLVLPPPPQRSHPFIWHHIRNVCTPQHHFRQRAWPIKIYVSTTWHCALFWRVCVMCWCYTVVELGRIFLVLRNYGDDKLTHTAPILYVHDTQFNQFTGNIPWIYV